MEIAGHITRNRQLAERVCQRLTVEINKPGFKSEEIKRYPNYDDAS